MPPRASRRPGRPPASKADDTRKRIVKAARAVFSEHGYDAATFQAIAERSDLTRPALNHYFSSKRALYHEVMEDSNELFITTSSAELARLETTLVGRLSVFINFAMRSNVANPSASAFWITGLLESHRHPELSGTDNEALRLRREFLTWAVNDAIENGEIASDTDVNTLVEALLVVLCGVGFYAGYLRSPEEMAAKTGTLRRLLSGDIWKFKPEIGNDPQS
jgi:TetR/AcrR family transcriptional repressor of uid operon